MVYRRYITVNGKRYGPYYYHSKRVKGKPKTLYVKPQAPFFKRYGSRNIDISSFLKRLYIMNTLFSPFRSGALQKRAVPFFAGLAAGIILLFILSLSIGFTGHASFEVGADYTDGS